MDAVSAVFILIAAIGRPFLAENRKSAPLQTASAVALSFDRLGLSGLLEEESPPAVAAASTGENLNNLPAVRLNEPPRQLQTTPAQTTLAARKPNNFTDIDEPNDELILGPREEQMAAALPARAQITVQPLWPGLRLSLWILNL